MLSLKAKNPWLLFTYGVLYAVVCPVLFYIIYVEIYYQGALEPLPLMQQMAKSSMLGKMIFLCMIPNYFALYICARKGWINWLRVIVVPTISQHLRRVGKERGLLWGVGCAAWQ